MRDICKRKENCFIDLGKLFDLKNDTDSTNTSLPTTKLQTFTFRNIVWTYPFIKKILYRATEHVQCIIVDGKYNIGFTWQVLHSTPGKHADSKKGWNQEVHKVPGECR